LAVKKQLVCPLCGFGRLIDAASDIGVELIPEQSIAENQWVPDFYQKCPCCRKVIGIRKLKNR